jgi:hypothetical protein
MRWRIALWGPKATVCKESCPLQNEWSTCVLGYDTYKNVPPSKRTSANVLNRGIVDSTFAVGQKDDDGGPVSMVQ